MPKKNPGVSTGARARLEVLSRPLFTLEAYQTQTLISAYAIRPELAVIIATLAFGGSAHG